MNTSHFFSLTAVVLVAPHMSHSTAMILSGLSIVMAIVSGISK